MNTLNVNVKTATKESSERWVKTSSLRTDGFVCNIHSRNPFGVIRADVQQKVDGIADMLHLMAHFSGITPDE